MVVYKVILLLLLTFCPLSISGGSCPEKLSKCAPPTFSSNNPAELGREKLCPEVTRFVDCASNAMESEACGGYPGMDTYLGLIESQRKVLREHCDQLKAVKSCQEQFTECAAPNSDTGDIRALCSAMSSYIECSRNALESRVCRDFPGLRSLQRAIDQQGENMANQCHWDSQGKGHHRKHDDHNRKHDSKERGHKHGNKERDHKHGSKERGPKHDHKHDHDHDSKEHDHKHGHKHDSKEHDHKRGSHEHGHKSHHGGKHHYDDGNDDRDLAKWEVHDVSEIDRQHCASLSSCEDCMGSGDTCAWCSQPARCGSARDMTAPSNCLLQHLTMFHNSSVVISPKPSKGPMNPRFGKVHLRRGETVKATAYLAIPHDARLKKKKKGNFLKIKIKHTSGLTVALKSDCVKSSKTNKRGMLLGVCQGVDHGHNVTLHVDVRLKECTDKPQFIVLKASGIKKAKSKFIVRPLCTCEHHQVASAMKTKHKKHKKDKKYKKKDKKKDKKKRKYKKDKKDKKKKDRKKRKYRKNKHYPSASNPPDSGCRSPINKKICSGNGDCYENSHCECRRPFSGQFCQCDDAACDYYGGSICGGPDRGVCQCSVCNCKPGFTGDACQTSLAMDKCVASNGVLCNGKGECINNICRCTKDSRGPTCEECPTCLNRCEGLRMCVRCFAFGSSDLDQEMCMNECQRENAVIRLYDKPRVESADEKMCMFRDRDDCAVIFIYSTSKSTDLPRTVVKVRAVKECKSPFKG